MDVFRHAELGMKQEGRHFWLRAFLVTEKVPKIHKMHYQ